MAFDLDEVPEYRLLEELNRRTAQQLAGLCDYCGQPRDTVACRFPERHAGVPAVETPLMSAKLAVLKKHVEQMREDARQDPNRNSGKLVVIGEILRTINTISTV